MKLPKILTAIAATTILLLSGTTHATNDYVDGVDWTKRVITVTGEGVAPRDAVNYTQAKGMASKAAQADAYRKLGEMINGVHVEGETTIERMVTTQDKIQLKVAATIKGAKIINETFLTDGGYR
ncbi:MAG: LPP20 family lipoprotein, partial [Selenomonadaceae bacterium]|nr:LPP20 family lipoprotein [Selenomonadaceae bacterium]